MPSDDPSDVPGGKEPMDCAVWWGSPACDAAAAAALLDEDERARCATFVRAADRRRFAGARLLARRAVAAELGCDPGEVRFTARCAICGGPHGKPRVAGARVALDLSIAHAHDRVVVAVAVGCAVGVDVERIGPFEDLVSAAAGVLDHEERGVLGELAEAERPAAFFAYWTRKEALLKATGQGLAIAPSSVRVTPPGRPAAVVCGPPGISPARVRMRDLDAGSGYAACLALIDGPPAKDDAGRDRERRRPTACSCAAVRGSSASA
jgi:4'-phosphopantetheinyl transferase